MVIFLPGSRTEKSDKFCMKWFCGVDRDAVKVKQTAQEVREQLLKLTNIDEDPYYKKVLDINAVVCLGACVFLLAFWA